MLSNLQKRAIKGAILFLSTGHPTRHPKLLFKMDRGLDNYWGCSSPQFSVHDWIMEDLLPSVLFGNEKHVLHISVRFVQIAP